MSDIYKPIFIILVKFDQVKFLMVKIKINMQNRVPPDLTAPSRAPRSRWAILLRPVSVIMKVFIIIKASMVLFCIKNGEIESQLYQVAAKSMFSSPKSS